MKIKAEKFKTKGVNILKGQQTKPNSMKDFLKDSPDDYEKGTQIHKYTFPQFHKITNPQIHSAPEVQKEELGRVHIQMRQDLVDKLLDAVFKRKRDPKVKNQDATQRAIIEKALENYFKNEKNISADQT
jgi:hypothetical protein